MGVPLIKPFVLASLSPRRQYLLRQVGFAFDIRDSGVEEIFDLSATPAENVRRLAVSKARAVAHEYENAIILGADTTVVLGGEILNKPADEKEAAWMLGKLSGNYHEVYTGFALLDRPSGRLFSSFEMTKVKFRVLAAEEIHDYVRSGSPLDKAGAYGIQDDFGALFVERIEGCFYNVIGLPLARVYQELQEFQRLIGAQT